MRQVLTVLILLVLAAPAQCQPAALAPPTSAVTLVGAGSFPTARMVVGRTGFDTFQVNLGSYDGVRRGAMLQVSRDGAPVCTARVVALTPSLASARIVEGAAVQPADRIEIMSNPPVSVAAADRARAQAREDLRDFLVILGLIGAIAIE